MNVIKLFADGKNSIKEIMALKHILRYLGLYVIENPQLDSKEYDVKSIADIYVVKKNDKKEQYVNNNNWNKTILISDSQMDFNNVPVIIDTSGCISLSFLQTFTDQLLSIIESDINCVNNLIINSNDYRNIVKVIIEAYVKNDMFESSIYIKYFYPNESLYDDISRSYMNYISAVMDIYEKYYTSDLLTYNIIYAMYEMNLACKKNNHSHSYPDDLISKISDEIRIRFKDNEEAILLSAEVACELKNSWAKAANEYDTIYLEHCSYAHYKRGRILRKYVNDIVGAKEEINKAIEYKPDCYKAWFQYAVCNDDGRNILEAYTALNKVYEILYSNMKDEILSPVELEYLYKAELRLQQLNKKYYILQQLSNDYDKLIYDIEENAGKYIECYINNVCFNLAQNEKNDLRDEIKEEVHNRLMEYKKQINN